MKDVIVGTVVNSLLKLTQRHGIKSQLNRGIYRGPTNSHLSELFDPDSGEDFTGGLVKPLRNLKGFRYINYFFEC